MDLKVEIEGEIVERQELLNGTQSVSLQGASSDGEWTLSGILSWNLGLVDFAGEGDLNLARRDGAEIFATLTSARVTDAEDDSPDADHAFAAAYDVESGTGAFEGVRGSAEAAGALAGDGFRGTWTLQIAAP